MDTKIYEKSSFVSRDNLVYILSVAMLRDKCDNPTERNGPYIATSAFSTTAFILDTMIAATRDRRVSDPLTVALQPPPNETPAARDARLASEREAKKISDSIDEQIRQEKESRKAKLKARKQIKVLLLGQSESGKSTTLKREFPPDRAHIPSLVFLFLTYLRPCRVSAGLHSECIS